MLVTVVGRSMEPALRSGDVVLVDTLDRQPSTGDIIVYRSPIGGEPGTALMIKVVIGATGGLLNVAGTGLSQTSEQLGPVRPPDVVGVARRVVAPLTRLRRLRPLDLPRPTQRNGACG
jgi:signal peptidase I